MKRQLFFDLKLALNLIELCFLQKLFDNHQISCYNILVIYLIKRQNENEKFDDRLIGVVLCYYVKINY